MNRIINENAKKKQNLTNSYFLNFIIKKKL